MRDGITDQLPRVLAKDQIVVVFGPSNYPGQNHVKQLIDQLNRPDGWIKSVFRDQISADKVSQNASVVLTMHGVNHGVLTTVRRAAEMTGVCCPNQALTPGEVKDILRLLAEVRGKTVSTLPGSHNGNENHPLPGKGEAQRLGDLTKSARQTGEAFTNALHSASEMLTASEPVASSASIPTGGQVELSEVPSEVESAIAAIEKLQSAAEETNLALLVMSDRLKAASAERGEFEKRIALMDETIAAKGIENAELRTRLETAAEEKEAFRKKNEGLESENRRLRNTLDQFEKLIKGVRQ
jgi:hypothetical protein